MTDFTLWDIARNLLLAGRWTLLLSAIAFAGGGFFGLVLLLIRIGTGKWLRRAVSLYVELFQSTPLLMQLFMVYFGLPRLGIDVSAWLAAAVCLTLYSSAFLTDIWRGAVEAIPRGQWDGSASLGLHYLAQLRLVILPQAMRMGFHELTRTAQILTNATFQPFVIYGMVALIYFAICYPLTELSRRLERQLMTSAR